MAAGFGAGFYVVYGLDLLLHQGEVAGEHSAEHSRVERHYRRHRPHGDQATVLTSGPSIEEIAQGLAIGAGAAIDPRLAVLLGISIAIDNVSDGLTVGEFVVGSSPDSRYELRRIIMLTGSIGAALLCASVVGGLLLREAPDALLAFVFALGAGAILYLTVTELVPEAQARHFQQSSAVATAAGFLLILVLEELL